MIEVHLFRPERRFGWGVVIHRQNPVSGIREVMHIKEDGYETWKPFTPEIEVSPTFFLDDVVMRAVTDAYQETPQGKPSIGHVEALTSHLSDAQETRDQLLEMVKHWMMK